MTRPTLHLYYISTSPFFPPNRLADHVGSVFNADMKMSSPDSSVKPSRRRRGRRLVVLLAFAALVWSLPRPQWQDVVVEFEGNTPSGRLAFRTAERLAELSSKGTLADETELSGPCFADDGQTLYLSRARPGQKADIVRSQFTEEGWSKPEPVRELNSVDDDRRIALSADGAAAVLASNRSGGRGGFDLYESALSNDRWSRPRNAGAAINTDAEEFDPALTPDGLRMYFVRVVPGTSADIFVTRREKLGSAWSAPELAESINSPNHHERSPAVSPDGSWLLFASNRSDRVGESTPFDLFRAPLRNGHVGAAERLRDGIASDTDDVDAAFASNGQSLLFASKREGAKQIFLSRGEFVVPRLTISIQHLAPFGPNEWMLPILATLVWLLAWSWSRRAPLVVVVEAPKVATVAAPLKRSEPPKNPLQTWSVAPLEQVPPPAPAVNPLLVAKAAEPTTISPPVSAPADASPSRRGRWAALVVVVAASVAFVVIRREPIEQTSSNPPIAIFEMWAEFAKLSDVAPPRAEEFPKLERTSTARTDAPQPIAPPSNVTALRPGARWPVDRVVVRQRTELAGEGEIDQRLLSRTKAVVLARQPLPTTLARPQERPAEVAAPAGVVATVEPPHNRAPVTSVKQAFDAPSGDRTAILPVAVNQATLRAPVVRRDPLLPFAPTTLSDSLRDLLVRGGPATRGVTPSSLAEPEALIGATAAAAVAVEAPVPTRVVSPSRTEFALVGQPTGLNSSLPSVRRTLPTSAQAQSPMVTAEVARPTNNAERSQLPIKSPAPPKAIPLAEEVTVPVPNTSFAESSTLTLTSALPRVETSGPQPALTTKSNGLATTRAELPTLRTSSRLDAAEIATLTTKTTMLARRETIVPAAVSIAAVDLATGMGTAAPAILLTSTSMLVELLTSAPLPELPHADSGNPVTSPLVQTPGQLAPWLARVRTWTASNTVPVPVEPKNVSSQSALPRRTRETVPAELIESIPTTP